MLRASGYRGHKRITIRRMVWHGHYFECSAEFPYACNLKDSTGTVYLRPSEIEVLNRAVVMREQV